MISHNQKILAESFDKATHMYSMQVAIDEGDFIGAMHHHLEFLYHHDEMVALYNANPNARKVNIDFLCAIHGVKFE